MRGVVRVTNQLQIQKIIYHGPLNKYEYEDRVFVSLSDDSFNFIVQINTFHVNNVRFWINYSSFMGLGVTKLTYFNYRMNNYSKT